MTPQTLRFLRDLVAGMQITVGSPNGMHYMQIASKALSEIDAEIPPNEIRETTPEAS